MTKVVLITGSSGGIGSALVKVYSEAGFFVIGLDKIQNDNHNDDSDYSYINIDLLDFAKNKNYREEKVKEIVGIFRKVLIVRVPIPILVTRTLPCTKLRNTTSLSI